MTNSLRLLILLGPVVGIVAGIIIDREILNQKTVPMPSETAMQHDPGEMNQAETETAMQHALKHMDPTYVCPMHSQIVSKDADSTCPICGMHLVPVKDEASADADDSGHPTVHVSAAVINSLGVKTEKLVRKNLSRRVETPGFVQQIKKGKMTFYKAPFDGTIKEYFATEGDAYKKKGMPVVALESELLEKAQQEHLEVYAAADDKATSAGSTEAVEDAPGSDVESLANFLDEDGKLVGEYREKLYAMGHTDDTIAEMEKEMASMIGEYSKQEKAAGTDKKDKVDNNDKHDDTLSTLQESRQKLRQLGMRDADIRQLEKTGEPTKRLVMYATHNGRILDKRFAEGMEVSEGERMFKLGGEVRATVVANAFQRDAAWITTGQRVEIRMPHESGVVYPGIVNQGAISINPDSQNIGIRLTFTAPLDKVRSNMYVNGTIFGDARKDVIAVPTQSIIRTEGEDRVIKALGDGRFKPVAVKLGLESGAYTEIDEGLEEGDEVVVMAQFLIDSESSLQASLLRLTSE